MELKASVHSGAHEGKEQLEAELALMEKELERYRYCCILTL
jgi:hypothetical protein